MKSSKTMAAAAMRVMLEVRKREADAAVAATLDGMRDKVTIPAYTMAIEVIDADIDEANPDLLATSWTVEEDDDDGLAGWTRLSQPQHIEEPQHKGTMERFTGQDRLILPTTAPENPVIHTDGKRASCGCGCGRFPAGRRSRFVPGHDARVPHMKYSRREAIVHVAK